MAFFWTEEDRISLETLADFFDQTPDADLLKVFDFQLRDGQVVTIKDKFKTHFHGMQCRYIKGRDEEIAKQKFLLIFEESIFDLLKLKRYKEQIIKDLQNFGLYQDEIHTNYRGNSNVSSQTGTSSTQTDEFNRSLIEGSLTGSSSAATMSSARDKTQKVVETKNLLAKSEAKMLDYLDPNAKDVQQTVALYQGGQNTTIAHNLNSTAATNTGSNSNSLTATSNPKNDRLEFLNMKIPELTIRYLDRFKPLFIS